MTRPKPKTVVLIAATLIFAALFITSTCIYFITNPHRDNIALECKVYNLADVKEIETSIKKTLSVDSNDISIFNGGIIEFDLIGNALSRIMVNLIINSQGKYTHYQVQCDNGNVYLIDFGTVNEEDIKPFNLLINILEPISKIQVDKDKNVLKIDLDSMTHYGAPMSKNSYIYNNSTWKVIETDADGTFNRIIASYDNVTMDNKIYYIRK